MNIFVVIEVMMKLLAVMLLGFFLCRKDILNHEVSKKLSWMVVNVTSPLLVISSVFQVTVEDRSVVWGVLLTGILCYLGFIAAAVGLSWLLRIPKGKRGIYQFMLVFANTAFMGYPVLQSLYGTESIFYASIYGIPFNLLVYTYGIYVIRNDRVGEGSDQGGQGFHLKSIINVGTISSILAILIFVFAIPFPRAAIDFCEMVGNTTTPLSMMILGASLSDISLKEMLREGDLYLLAGLRLFGIPFLLYGACRLFGVDPFLTAIAVISAAMPGASMSVMMSQTYDGNTEFASKGVVFTTILCVITLPIVAAVTGLV